MLVSKVFFIDLVQAILAVYGGEYLLHNQGFTGLG